MADKVGRNKSCPCGSGMKYKRCCLIKRQEYDRQQQEIRRHIDEFTKKSSESKGAEKDASQEDNQEL